MQWSVMIIIVRPSIQGHGSVRQADQLKMTNLYAPDSRDEDADSNSDQTLASVDSKGQDHSCQRLGISHMCGQRDVAYQTMQSVKHIQAA